MQKRGTYYIEYSKSIALLYSSDLSHYEKVETLEELIKKGFELQEKGYFIKFHFTPNFEELEKEKKKVILNGEEVEL